MKKKNIDALEDKKKDSSKKSKKAKARRTNKKAKRTSKKRNDYSIRIQPAENPTSADISIIRRAIHAINRNIRRNSVTGAVYSPAFEELDESGGRVLDTNGDYGFLYGEYLRGLNFMQNPTHTERGYRKWVEETGGILQNFYEDIPVMSAEEIESRTSMYWKAFRRVMQVYPYFQVQEGKMTDLIDQTKDECINNRELDLDGMYAFIENKLLAGMDDMGMTTKEDYSWTFATQAEYEAASEFESSYVYTRPDFRRRKKV